MSRRWRRSTILQQRRSSTRRRFGPSPMRLLPPDLLFSRRNPFQSHRLNLASRTRRGIDGDDVELRLALDHDEPLEKPLYPRMFQDIGAIDLQRFVRAEPRLDETGDGTGLLRRQSDRDLLAKVHALPARIVHLDPGEIHAGGDYAACRPAADQLAGLR